MWCLCLSTEKLFPQLLSRLKENVSFFIFLNCLLKVNVALVDISLNSYMKKELIFYFYKDIIQGTLYNIFDFYYCNIYVHAIFLFLFNSRSMHIGNPEKGFHHKNITILTFSHKLKLLTFQLNTQLPLGQRKSHLSSHAQLVESSEILSDEISIKLR